MTKLKFRVRCLRKELILQKTERGVLKISRSPVSREAAQRESREQGRVGKDQEAGK